MKIEHSRDILEKYSIIKFHENPFTGSRVFPSDGQTDRHGRANSRFVQFGERAYKL
jgi:hypothetical protein